MKKTIVTRILGALLSAALVFTMMPQAAYAVPENNESVPVVQEDVAVQDEGESAEEDLNQPAEENQEETAAQEQESEDAAQEQESEDAAQEQSPAFSQTETVDDVGITVEAEEGVFPSDAVLYAEKITKKEQEEVDAAVEKALDNDRNIGLSYSFDVKVLDPEGNELQPADGNKVSISFRLDRVKDPNLDAEVYHITETDEGELTAEKLDADTDIKAGTVTAETDGFSSYTVTFTYDGTYYYEFKPESSTGEFSRNLTEIVHSIGLTGDIQNAVVSDDRYLAVSKNQNETWNVTVRQFFYDEQTITVTINGADYKIRVRAVPDGTQVDYLDENGDSKICYEYIPFTGTGHMNDGWWVINKNTQDSHQRVVVYGDVHLIVTNDAQVVFKEGIQILDGSSLTIYGQQGHRGKIVAKGNEDNAGIGVEKNSTLTVNGANINGVGGEDGAGIGGGDEMDCGTIIINDGTVKGEGSYHGAGIGGGYGTIIAGSITINGGTVTGDSLRNGSSKDEYIGAGIGGGGNARQGGPITINGGTVHGYGYYGAGIGGGAQRGNAGGEVVINDGIVTATSTYGAGIGGGGERYCQATIEKCGDGGDVKITGGEVFAASNSGGAGIGGGSDSQQHVKGGGGGKLEVTGGTVMAASASVDYSWVQQITVGGYTDVNLNGVAALAQIIMEFILGDLSEKVSAAAIGGGFRGNGGDVKITGGIVVADSGEGGKAIGRGQKGDNDGSLDIGSGMFVKAGPNYDQRQRVAMDERVPACRDNVFAEIRPGPLRVTFDVTPANCQKPVSQEVELYEWVKRPKDPSAEGWIFDGWCTDQARTKLYDFDKQYTGSGNQDMTLYARWIRKCDLTVTKEWSAGQHPGSLAISYDHRSRGMEHQEDTLILSEDNAWSGTISISNQSVLTLGEEDCEGFFNDGWKIAVDGGSVRLPVDKNGKATLNLKDQGSSGLSKNDYNKVKAAVETGSAGLSVVNKKAKVFSVEKVWDIGASSDFKPDELKVVLQKNQNGSWKTVETVRLNKDNAVEGDNNKWRAEFKPVEDEGENNASIYRIRELDQNGRIVFDRTDADGPGTDPSVTFRVEPETDRELNVRYEVKYETAENGLTTITNKAGTAYKVRISWAGVKPDAKPESVIVSLYEKTATGRLVTVPDHPSVTLNQKNGWEGAISVVEDGKNYVLREEWHDGQTTAYNEDDTLPSYVDDSVRSKAQYKVREDGKTHLYVYDVTYEVQTGDDGIRTTLITNNKTGIVFNVKKKWDVPEDSEWPRRIYAVNAVVQHRTVDEQGKIKWELIDDGSEPRAKYWKGLRTDVGNWSCTFNVPLSEGFDADDYRVREVIRHYDPDIQPPTETYNNRTYVTDTNGIDRESFTTQMSFPDPVPAKVMLLADDEDNANKAAPVFYSSQFAGYGQEPERVSFTVSYDIDENGTYIISNHQGGYISVEKKWVDEDGNTLDKWKPENVKVVLQKKNGENWEDQGDPVELNEENNWKHFFNVSFSEADKDSYRVRELDQKNKPVEDGSDAVRTIRYNDEDTEIAYSVKYEAADENGNYVIENKINAVELEIEKKWEIDLEKKDRPESIGVIIQKKTKDDEGREEWEKAGIVKLDNDCEWKTVVLLPKTRKMDNGEREKIEYRMRELRQENAITELLNSFKDKIDKGRDGYNEWIGQFEESEYYSYLPEDVQNAANEGYDSLLDTLNTTEDKLYDKLMEELNIAYKPEQRIVYDKEDQEYKDLSDEDKKDSNKEANRVSFYVNSYESAVSGGTEAGHTTRYMVKYETEDDGRKITITNKAILEITEIKRWLKPGDEDLPDSVWVVLMFRLNPEAMEKAGDFGVDVSSLRDLDLPAFSGIPLLPDILVEGGNDPISIISSLALGIDLNIFEKAGIGLPKMAIEKVEKPKKEGNDNGWRTSFAVSKYALGIPVEYRGAELGSEIIRRIIKYLTQEDVQVYYNPLQNFISIPTKAISEGSDITEPGDLIDFSALSEAAREEAETITMDEINDFGWGSILDMWRLMANVINIRITDSDDENLVEVTKTWKNDKEEDRPDTLTIHIRDQEGNEIGGAPIELKKEDFKGKNTWSYLLDLSKDEDEENSGNSSAADGDYEITEEYPEGYGHEDDYTLETNGFDLINIWHEDELQTVDVSGRKIWEDSNDHDGKRPDKITVRLKADGEEVAHAETSRIADWKWSFTGLPKYREGSASEKIIYTIEEDAVDGYETEVNGYNITNTHEIETVEIEGVITWDDGDDQDGKRPGSITIVLSADGKEIARKYVSASDDWKWNFRKLPKYDNGSRIYYSISEEKVTGYRTKVDEYDVTNTYEPETVDIDGRKTWKDNNDQAGKRPDSITIRLKADGDEVDSVTVSAADGWKWEFNDLPKNRNGKRITYTITEDAVDDYMTSVNGYNITNTYTPGKIQINVQKSWQDNDNQDGIRPSYVVVKLLADGEDTGKSLTLSAGNSWSGSFMDIDQTKDGTAIAYTIEEQTTDVITGEDAAGTYAFAVEGDAQVGFTVTNTHTPETMTIKATKVWDDNSSEAGKRPDEITLRLKADGQDYRTVAIEGDTDDPEWTKIFEDVPKYNNGKEITYTLSEDPVESYETEISGNAAEGFTVRNTYFDEPAAKTRVNVSKVWNDENDQDGIRPRSVIVKLLADEEDTGKTLELNESNQWTAAFEDLDAERNGSNIEYSVEEVRTDVITGFNGRDSYSIKVEGDAAGGFTITNTHTPSKISIDVTKVWDDADDQDGIRPDTVTMQLRGSVQGYWIVYKTITLDENSNWSGAFTDVDKNGRYSVAEEVTGVISGNDQAGSYAFSVVGSQEKGYVVTNTHTPVLTERTVCKKWDDSDNADGIRPAALNVKLREKTAEGGNDVRTVTLNADNNWKATVGDLPAYRKGEAIEYSWTEEAVEDYQLTKTDVSKDTTTFTNKHEPAKTSIKVIKKWMDNDDSDGFRPDSVEVKLLADGKDTGKRLSLSKEDQTDENRWEGSFTDLNVNQAGRKIDYTVEEVRTDVITGTDGAETYAYEVTGDEEQGFTVTNTHTPQTCSRTIRKVWKDENDAAHERPETLAVTLYGWNSGSGTGSDSESEAVQTLTLSADNQWTATKDGLPVYRDGRKINYYWEEEEVPGYGLSAISEDGEITTFTNSRALDTLDLTCGIEWDDADDQDGIRPKSIVMVLYAESGGRKKAVQIVSLSEQDGWKRAEVKDLPVYDDDGNRITYTWEPRPKETEGYGHYSYTNGTHTQFVYWHYPAFETIEVCKIWNDANDQDGIRPDSITVNLYEGSAVKETVVLTRDNAERVRGIKGLVWYWNWSYLPKYKDGEPLTYSIEEEAVGGYTTSMTDEPETIGDELYRYTIINTHKPARRNIGVTTEWMDNNDSDGFRQDSAEVRLLADGKDTGKRVILSEEDHWTGSFEDVDVNNDGRTIDYTVEEIRNNVIIGTDGEKTYAAKVTGDAENSFTITNTHTPVLVDKTIEKLWDDDDNNDGMRPDSLEVTLYETGSNSREAVETITLKKTKDWTAVIRDLPKYRDGVKINYSWDEEEVDGYVLTDTVVDGDTTTLINTHAALETSMSAGIEWDDADDQDGIRPESIVMVLYTESGGRKTAVQRVSLSEHDGWKRAEVKDMPMYDDDGNRITYTWEPEPKETEGYGHYSYTSGTHTQFIYWHYPAYETIEVCKLWDDADDQDGVRPDSILVNLYEGSTVKETVELTGDNAEEVSGIEGKVWYRNWSYLPKYKDGEPLTYSIEEEAVDGYTTSMTDEPETIGDELYRYTITNSHTPEKMNIDVTKKWEDNDDGDGFRPDSVEVKLLADGKDTGKRLILSEENHWAGSFEDVDVNKNGQTIDYTVEEIRTDVITGTDGAETYAYEVTGDEEQGFTVTNTHTPQTCSRTIRMVWNDENDAAHERPETLAVTLYGWNSGSGAGSDIEPEAVQTFTLSADNQWTATKDGLPVYRDGVKISYSWGEEEADGYVLTDTAVDGDTTTLINTYAALETSMSVGIEWDDQNNNDGIRPEEMQFELYAEYEDSETGEVRSEKVEGRSARLEKDDWETVKQEGLPLYRDGAQIRYTWKPAVMVKDYGMYSYTTGTHTQFVYRHYPETVDLEGSITWDDADDQAGKRPESITIRLFANGVEAGTRVVTKADNWMWRFTDLRAKAEGGKTISYTIKEDEVSGYTTTVDGFNVTNKYIESGPEPGPEPGEKQYTITYDLNGGSYDGSTVDISEKHNEGEVISIHAAPVRNGYTFSYWKGSAFHPGDRYTVTEDHTFVAQWQKDSDPADPDKPSNGPGTGDDVHLGIWLALLLMSLTALISVAVLYWKREREV